MTARLTFRHKLDRQPGDTKRGIPAGFTHPALCGARTKAGHPCRALKVKGRKRCKWHGGLSTGPRTAEGKARCTANLPARSICRLIKRAIDSGA